MVKCRWGCLVSYRKVGIEGVVCLLQDHPVDVRGNMKRTSGTERQWICFV